jgi:hypothetical protein
MIGEDMEELFQIDDYGKHKFLKLAMNLKLK